MKIRIALILTILAIGFHAYLTDHYYGLVHGTNVAESVCNINSTFNCDSVSASSYSTFLGAPVALWGAITNGVLLLLLLGWVLAWTDDLARLARYTLWLSGGIALASVVMGTISTFVLKTYCLFCMGAYVTSFLNFYLVWSSRPDDNRTAGQHLKALFTEARTYLIFVLAIPLVSLLAHLSVTKKPNMRSLQRQAQVFVSDWRTAPTLEFANSPVLIKGAEDGDAKMTITEFADFRCGHCKTAVPTLNAFLSSRPDVQLRFYSYPLDKSCNDSVIGENGISCLLAKAVICAEDVQNNGWLMHDRIFANQEEINAMGTLDRVKQKINEIASAIHVDRAPFQTCLEGTDVHERLRSMSKEATDAGVAGTPSFFVNGRRLVGGQLLPVLESVYNEIKGR